MDPPAILRVAPCLEALAHVRGFVRESGAELGADEERLTELVRAVDEAATNIVMHAECGESALISVELVRVGDDLHAKLVDPGRPYDPTATPPPDPNIEPWERQGGLGVHLMRRLTDALHYRHTPGGGNELTLIKNCAPWRQDQPKRPVM